jgi:hypothetical protein
MRTPDVTGMKYIAVGFACVVIALAILRTLGFENQALGVTGAILFSVLVASTRQSGRRHARTT